MAHLPYATRLYKLRLTTLLERRCRGDLIETFRITSNQVPYGQHLFKISRNGYNIIQTKTKRDFLPNRIANYWNKVPRYVKNSYYVDEFKIRLQEYKEDTQFKPQDKTDIRTDTRAFNIQ